MELTHLQFRGSATVAVFRSVTATARAKKTGAFVILATTQKEIARIACKISSQNLQDAASIALRLAPAWAGAHAWL